MTDNVNHPAHYENQRVILEPIDLCQAYDFSLGNAIKYIIRAGKKDGNSEEQDLAKARWYLRNALETMSSARPVEPDGNRFHLYLTTAAIMAYSVDNPLIQQLFQAYFKAVEDVKITSFGVQKCIEAINQKIGVDK